MWFPESPSLGDDRHLIRGVGWVCSIVARHPEGGWACRVGLLPEALEWPSIKDVATIKTFIQVNATTCGQACSEAFKRLLGEACSENLFERQLLAGNYYETWCAERGF